MGRLWQGEIHKHPARTNPEKQVVLTDMEMNVHQKRQRSRAFTFDSPTSGRTKAPAIELAHTTPIPDATRTFQSA